MISAPRTTSDRLVGDCVFDGQFVFGDHVGDHWGSTSGADGVDGIPCGACSSAALLGKAEDTCLVVW